LLLTKNGSGLGAGKRSQIGPPVQLERERGLPNANVANELNEIKYVYRMLSMGYEFRHERAFIRRRRPVIDGQSLTHEWLELPNIATRTISEPNDRALDTGVLSETFE
jgi:hypothetical protein